MEMSWNWISAPQAPRHIISGSSVNKTMHQGTGTIFLFNWEHKPISSANVLGNIIFNRKLECKRSCQILHGIPLYFINKSGYNRNLLACNNTLPFVPRKLHGGRRESPAYYRKLPDIIALWIMRKGLVNICLPMSITIRSVLICSAGRSGYFFYLFIFFLDFSFPLPLCVVDKSPCFDL